MQRLSTPSRVETRVAKIRQLDRFRAAPALDPTLLHMVFGAGGTHTDRVRVERTAEPDLFSAAEGGMCAFVHRLVGKHSKKISSSFHLLLLDACLSLLHLSNKFNSF